MKKLLLIIFLSLFFTVKVHAVGEFEAKYDLSYAISPSGKTTVTQQISLVNVLSNFYPQKYALLIDSDKISQVIAYDEGGIITPQVSVKNGKTEIALTFNTKIVGLGKATKFTLRYEHAGVATKNGSIWEIYIPGVVNDPEIDSYNVTLSVPGSFGPVAYLSPPPNHGNTWVREQMIRGGIAAAYGSSQHFNVDLSYELENKSGQTVYQEIAIPPDTAFQQTIIKQIAPKPVSVTKDADGNWLARYDLKPRQKLQISANLHIATYLAPRKDFTLPPPDVALYVKPLEFWSIDPELQKAVEAIQTPREIYRFVVDTLSYDESKITKSIERLGASLAYKQPTAAVCMEFTDLFIAIARSKGIAARRNVGYAYTDNEKLRPLSLLIDVLHTWPEYYDTEKNIWVPVDPTWADTTGGLDYFDKLDFNHIVFAIHGLDSSLPYPAGFYHDPKVDKKDVSVTFAATAAIINQQPIVTTTVQFPQKISFWFVGHGEVLFENTSGKTQKNINYSIKNTVNNKKINSTISEILPYEKVRVPIDIKAPFTLNQSSALIQVEANDLQTNYSFHITPPYLLLIATGLGILSCILLIVRLITHTK